DTIACVLATRLYDSEKKRALVDIGTNGEVVMGDRSGLMACSAPAGPALEGAQIRHGMRGAVGAIEKVEIDADVTCTVIGNAPAIGICGSGLIDAAAAMLKSNVMNPSGLLEAEKKTDLPLPIASRFSKTDDGKDQFSLVSSGESGREEDIVLTQNDIRQLQLAKGAIVSGIIMLQKVMEIADDDLDELMLCGGFGNYISIESAVDIKLLPKLPTEKISYVGNAAHLGAQMALLSEEERLRAENIAQDINHVALATHPDFQEIFVEALKFG
ncbi:MAG: metal-binding protein, partial [Acidiferrobacteraceae bacterium]|nr:metal-binding protein [Acidiferrobacteraceae bacterium]